MSYMQIQRKNIITQMQSWINAIREAKNYDLDVFPVIDELQVKRLAMLKFGCTKEKAEEYLALIFDRSPNKDQPIIDRSFQVSIDKS